MKTPFSVFCENNRYGIIDASSTIIVPAIYDEIFIPTHHGYDTPENSWLCRICGDWDIFSLTTGALTIGYRTGCTPLGLRTAVDAKINMPLSISTEQNGLLRVYSAGKFGCKSLEDEWILPPIFDGLTKWFNADVIRTRIGHEQQFYTTAGKPILTDATTCGGYYDERDDVEYTGLYSDKYFYSTDETIKKIVAAPINKHTYQLNNGEWVSFDYLSHNDYIKTILPKDAIVPLPSSLRRRVANKKTLHFDSYILTFRTDDQHRVRDDVWRENIKRLEMMGAFCYSEFSIEQFATNSNTRLHAADLYNLFLIYKKEMCPNVAFGYYIDNTLADNEVRWMHSNCDFDAIRYHDLNFDNIEYDASRPWRETKSIFEKLSNMHLDPRDLMLQAFVNLFPCSGITNRKELLFWQRCWNWALSKAPMTNLHTPTLYDEIVAEIDKYKESHPNKKLFIDIFEEIQNEALLHGALTTEQVHARELELLQSLISNPYDYEVIKNIPNVI